MTFIRMERISKRYADFIAVNDLSLSLEKGETVVLLGPSGCGKTTTLRMLAGFERPDIGEIWVGDMCVASKRHFVPPERRGLGVVFQNYALWPHLTVIDNVSYGLRLRKRGARSQRDKEIRKEANEALAMVQLAELGDRYPHQLSGGQQQRVALARALITEPMVLLLDEPLSNLDARMREEMRIEIKRLQRRMNLTLLYVTHDQTEALLLGDRVVVMSHGRIEQQGRPEEIYNRPRTAFAASALGEANLVQGFVSSWSCKGTGTVRIFDKGDVKGVLPDRTNAPRIGSKCTVCIRPSAIKLTPVDGNRDLIFEIRVRFFLGNYVQYVLRHTATGQLLRATGPLGQTYQAGALVCLDVTEATIVSVNEGDEIEAPLEGQPCAHLEQQYHQPKRQ